MLQRHVVVHALRVMRLFFPVLCSYQKQLIHIIFFCSAKDVDVELLTSVYSLVRKINRNNLHGPELRRQLSMLVPSSVCMSLCDDGFDSQSASSENIENAAGRTSITVAPFEWHKDSKCAEVIWNQICRDIFSAQFSTIVAEVISQLKRSNFIIL